MSPEMACTHVYVEDDGLQLEIDCSMCQGAHDLSNPRCYAGVLNAMVSGAVPDAIILKRYMHKRYRQDAVAQAAIAAAELATLNRAIASVERASDKRCRTCSASKENVLRTMKSRLMEDPGAYLMKTHRVLDEVRAKNETNHCDRSKKCVESAFSASTLLKRSD
ncbi:MAG: hypothetical protein ACUVT7_06630 [Thermoplasmata archaeon]